MTNDAPLPNPVMTNSLNDVFSHAIASQNRWSRWTVLRTATILLGFVTTFAATFMAAVPKETQWLPPWIHPMILALVAAFTALTTALTSYYDTVAKRLVESEACLAKLHGLQDALSQGKLSSEEAVKALSAIRDAYPTVTEYQSLYQSLRG